MKQTAYIRYLSAQDEKVLEAYKNEKQEKTNTKAFVMAIYDYFEQKKRIEDLEKELKASKSREESLKNKYQKYDIVFDGIKSIINNK
jgi:cation transport regulator ChaB